VRTVDQLEEEWEGTGSSHPSGMGKDWGQLGKVPSKGGKSYQLQSESRAYMPDPFHRCSIPTKNRHDAFSELRGVRGGEGKGTIPPKRGEPEGPGGRNPYTPMLPGSENKSRYTPIIIF
jgi:hypothetical protein